MRLGVVYFVNLVYDSKLLSCKSSHHFNDETLKYVISVCAYDRYSSSPTNETIASPPGLDSRWQDLHIDRLAALPTCVDFLEEGKPEYPEKTLEVQE